MRALISLTTCSAMILSRSDSSSPVSALAASPMDRSQISAMFMPLISTDSETGLRRRPSQVGQATSRM